MNQLDTLFFPDTVVSSITVTRLQVFFAKIYHYLPALRNLDAGENTLCFGFEPVPLGAEREKFYKTIRDIQNNLYGYGERLRQLSLASLTAGRPVDGDEASMSSLAAVLAGEPKTKEQAASETEELWQARIILKLAEDLDLNEESITSGFNKFVHREQDMLSGLKGEDELVLEQGMSVPGSKKIPLHLPHSVMQRCRAWTKLFRVDPRNSQQEVQPVLSIDRQECVDLLLEAYEKMTGKEDVVLFSLPLPGSHQQSEEIVTRWLPFFMAEMEDILMQCRNIISEPTRNGMAGLDEAGKILGTADAATWQAACDRFFPIAEFGRSWITLYCLGGVSLNDLLSKAFLGTRTCRSPSIQCRATLIVHLSL